MNDKLLDRLRTILSEVLNTGVLPNESPKREELPSWDSLKHMELILRLEEQFDIRFSIEEVAGITGLDDLAKIIEVKS
ncbi:acyl carrier protein [Paenibacillus dakarensis]|uniref:acyl carrier protein n=1 Tax=Paenibacillus dakarensis TaxID=1527293 RepID=UPI0006D59580|nr:acyl carrier protein [Paenibacillus dakarensis]